MINSLFKSIRTQLLVLVMISVLPALGIILYSGLTIQQKDIARAEGDVMRVVNSLDDDHGRIVDSTRQFLTTLSRLPDVQKQDAKACNRLFGELLKENPLYANIFSATAAGMVFSNARPFTPHSIRDRKYYQDVLKTMDFSVGEYVIGVTLKQPVLHFAYPVRDAGGGFKGMVVVAFDLNRYGRNFPMEGLPPGSRLNLSDHKNRVLYRYPDSQNHIGRVDNPDMIRNLSSQFNEGTFTGFGNDGIKCLYGYKRFYLKGETSPYLFLRMGIPEEQALSYARHAMVFNMALLGVALLFAMVLAWFLGRQLIVQRLRTLADAAKRFGQGDLKVRTGLKQSQDELGLLTKAFDEMAGALEDKESQRESAQAALRESEERYRTLIETTRDLIYTTDIKGFMTYMNTTLERTLGYARHEWNGKTFAQIVAPECIDLVRDRFKRAMNGESIPVYSVDLIKQDGTRLSVEFNVTTTYDSDGKPSGRYGIGRDITDRKKVEEALHESEGKYRSIFENSVEGIFQTNMDGRYINANPALARIFGYDSPEGMISSVVDIGKQLDVYPGQRKERLRLLDEKGAIEHYEAQMYRKDGSIFWVSINARLVRDDDSNPLYYEGFMIDITERKQADVALQKSEENYRQLFDNAPAAIYQIDFRTGKFTKANDVICGYLGYSQEEITSLSPYDVLTHESKRLFSERLKKIGLGEKVIENPEYEIVDRNGKRRWLQLNSKNIYNAEGLVMGADVVAHDITERKRAEEALRGSEARYRTLFEQVAVGVAEIEIITGRFLTVNRRLCELFGRTEEQLLATTYLAITHPDDLHLHEDKSALLLAGEIEYYTLEKRYISEDGATIWVNITVSHPWKQGEKSGYNIVVVEDITDRKKAEDDLKVSETNLRMILDSVDDAIFIYTKDGKIIDVNSKMLKMYGVSREEVCSMSIEEDFSTPENPINELPGIWESVVKGEERLFEWQARRPHDDSKFYVEVFLRKINLDNADFILAAVRDITERKRAEEEKRNLEERLSRAEKMEALGTLAGGVAHDLNNVLGVVVGYAELVLMKADESSSIRSQLVNIMNGGLKAAAIVDDLLTLARRGVSDRDVLNLNKIIADYQKSPEFEKLYSYHPSVKIKTDIDTDLPNISGSSVHLGKSLYNLISNASEAMAKGGTVTIRTTNQYLDKPIQGYDNIQEGDYVVLSVSDTGEGIQTTDLKRIFEPFYTKKVMGRSGTGLGLAVVWGTVKDHHGYINVESEEGKGSTFTLYFPVTREAITADAVAIDISEYMGSGESILVVDDVKEQRDLAAGMLRTLNYNVSSVSSGEEAIAYLKDHQAELIVLDMIMDPGVDGLDTYKQVLKIRPKQKAIIVSGFSESDRVRAARDLGAGAYVRKPYIKEKLGLAVRKELDRK